MERMCSTDRGKSCIFELLKYLKVKLARDNFIPNIFAKLYPLIIVGSRAMTVFVLKIATVTLTLSPGP